MKEYMLLIRNEIDHQVTWSPDHHQQFLKKCENYIGNLVKSGNLISAQPCEGGQAYFPLKRNMDRGALQ